MPSEQLQAFWRDHFGRDGPDKIVCVGLNYVDHAAESSLAVPERPLLFAKFSNTLVGPGEPIVLPRESAHVDAEAEIAVLIGEPARRVPRERVGDVVAGYTCANDVSARDIQFGDGQWLRGKSFDTFCPVLTTLVATVDEDARVVQRVNGEVLQDGPVRDMIFDIPTIVAHASDAFSLLPGDLILTGTPPGVGYFREPKLALAPGDVVEVDVTGVGVLSNSVVADA